MMPDRKNVMHHAFILWLRNVLRQRFGKFNMFKIFMRLPQQRAERAKSQAKAEMFKADRAFKHRHAV